MSNNDGAPPAKRPQRAVPSVVSVAAARRGERDEMQDVHVMEDTFGSEVSAGRAPLTPRSISSHLLRTTQLPEPVAYYAVFDGHGGRAAATHCAEYLGSAVRARWPAIGDRDGGKDLKKALIEAFLHTDKAFLQHAAQVGHQPSPQTASRAGFVIPPRV